MTLQFWVFFFYGGPQQLPLQIKKDVKQQIKVFLKM